MKLLRLVFFTVCTLVTVDSIRAQTNGYEQYAFNYFVDSLLEREFPRVKRIYYRPQIGVKHTELKTPIGFKDYFIKTIDSLDTVMVSLEQKTIKNLDLSQNRLKAKFENIKLKEYKKALIDQRFKKAILIEVLKRYIYWKDLYIVEIIVSDYETRTSYFFEINRDSNVINRWYKVVYMF